MTGLLGGLFPRARLGDTDTQYPLLGGEMPQIPFKNSAAITGLATSLIQGPDWTGQHDWRPVGIGMAQDNVMRGQMANRQAAAAKDAKAEAQRQQTVDAINNYPGLPDADRAFYAANPGAFNPAAFRPKPVTPTDDMREYEFAKSQGYQGTFQEYMTGMRKAGADNITVGGGKYGTIPSGYMLKEMPDGSVALVPIPGGPAATEAAEAAKKEDVGRETKTTAANIVSEDIDRAIAMIEKNPALTTGLLGPVISNIGGTPAADVAGLLDTVKSNIGFDKLQAMRDASPTGGALGQVSEFENRLLQATFGSLAQSQTAEQLIYNLRRVQRVVNAVVHEGIAEDSPLAREIMEGGSSSAVSPDGWTDLGSGVRIREKQ